jgi:serpin B
MRNLLPLLLLPSLATAASPPAPFAARLDAAFPQQGNLVYSPTSISIAMSLARAGAKGETAAQMDRVLGASAGSDAQKLISALPVHDQKGDSPKEPMLSVANRLYGDLTTPFAKSFLDFTRTQFGAEAQSVDFRHHAEAARLAINKWVEQQTHDKIRDLLGQGSVDAGTRAVLVNAIYLKAQWLTQFEPNATRPDAFAVAGGSSKKVPTMHGDVIANTGAHDGARLLDLPYFSGKGPRLSMLLVVPENRTLPMIEADYAREGLAPFTAAASTSDRVMLGLPKFETGSSSEVSTALQTFGMTDAFNDKADFSGMSANKTMISAVIHKAWIKVDEGGTEAAAATAVVMRDSAVVAGPAHSFAVDRSFLFFIHDDQGNVLFAGRIVDPSK